ncbi:response regulator [Rhizobium rhizoryzae]|uniref:DNA-binding response OmpR family regulator n=2 Tax=Rhizobium rhizoryzae TaxID=451876 RepID=A0A7W6LFJ0_9HYPH|nr:response regulator [Rhizobium rhizoryzae]MBB4142418.1 DNA-binding response OmpR family regulator [Rhizobium rhizoryzae]
MIAFIGLDPQVRAKIMGTFPVLVSSHGSDGGPNSMTYKILIVEDQLLIALHIEDAVMALGHDVVGIAANSQDAMKYAQDCEIALVDVQLQDGITGPTIGAALAQSGATVLFMTANPDLLGEGVPGTLGVISKPIFDLELVGAIQFAADLRSGGDALAPERFKRFEN